MEVTILFAPKHDSQEGKLLLGLMQAICDSLDMHISCFTSKCRNGNHTELRFITAYILKWKFPAMSLADIGTLFGNRDHTTILNCLEKAEYRFQTKDERFLLKYEKAKEATNIFFNNPIVKNRKMNTLIENFEDCNKREIALDEEKRQITSKFKAALLNLHEKLFDAGFYHEFILHNGETIDKIMPRVDRDKIPSVGWDYTDKSEWTQLLYDISHSRKQIEVRLDSNIREKEFGVLITIPFSAFSTPIKFNKYISKCIRESVIENNKRIDDKRREEFDKDTKYTKHALRTFNPSSFGNIKNTSIYGD